MWLIARTDRTGRRATVVGGAALTAVALAWFALGASAVALFVAATVWGFAATLMVHGAEIELAVRARGRHGELPRRLRQVNLWGTAGDVAGPVLLAGTLAAGGTWRTAFWIAAAATAAFTVWLSVLPFAPGTPDDELPGDDEPGDDPTGDEEPGDDPTGDARTGDDPVTGPTWRDPTAWRLGIVALLLVPFDETWLAFLIAWLQVEADWSEAPSILAGTGAVVGAALGFGPLSAWSRRWADRTVLVGSILAASAAGTVVDALPAGLAVASGVVVNAALAVAWVTLQHAVLVLRPGSEGRVTAFVAAIEHTAFVLPIGLGLVADTAGLRWVFVPFGAIGLAATLVAGSLGRGPRSSSHRRTRGHGRRGDRAARARRDGPGGR